MKDLETLRGAAVILTGMAESLNAIADMQDIATPDTTEKPSSGLAMTGMPTHTDDKAPTSNHTATIGVELDDHGKGIPWDHRIHTSTKKKTQKDIWKRRPGIADEEFNRIVTELKATMAAPTPATESAVTTQAPAATQPPPPPAEQVKTMTEKAGAASYETFIAQGWTDETLIAEGYMVMTDAPATAPPPPPAATASTVVSAEGKTFPELAALVTPAIQSNVITQAEVDGEAAKQGVDSIALLVSRPDLVPAVYASVQQLIDSRQ